MTGLPIPNLGGPSIKIWRSSSLCFSQGGRMGYPACSKCRSSIYETCGWSFSQELHKFLISLTTWNLGGWPNNPHTAICSTVGSQEFAFSEALHVLFQAYPGFLYKLDSVNKNIVFGKCYCCFQGSTYIVRNWLIEEWSLKRIWHFDLWAIFQICSCDHAAPWTVLSLR